MKKDNDFLNNMSRDSGYWYGPLYSNRKDPRAFVPKQSPAMGFTLNFGHPIVLAGVIVLLVALIASAFI